MPEPLDLTDFEAAYDRVERRLELERDWGRLEALVRRRLNRPTRKLWTTVALIIAAAAATLFGVGNGWMVALGLAFAVLPRRISDVRRRREVLTRIESSDDVRALVAEESRRRFGGILAGAILYTAFGLLFVLVGLVAWMLDKSPWPGVVAGAVLFAWSALLVVVALPRAARESAMFDGGDDDGDD